MSREERFQELARKKREEFNEDEEYKRQQTEKYAEKRKKLRQRVEPVIEEIARTLGGKISERNDQIWGIKVVYAQWELHLNFVGQGYSIGIYLSPDTIFVIYGPTISQFGYPNKYTEEISINNIEESALNNRLRNAIAKCVETIHPQER